MKSSIRSWRMIVGISLLVSLAAMIQAGLIVAGYGISIYLSSWGIPFYILLMLLVLVLSVTWTRGGQAAMEKLDGFPHTGILIQITVGLIFTLSLVAFFLLLTLPLPEAPQKVLDQEDITYLVLVILKSPAARLMASWFLGLMAAVCVRAFKKDLFWLAGSGIVAAILYTIVDRCAAVTPFPFALGWSEVSRYYEASLFFAQRLYGGSLPLPGMHPTWHFLLSLPYLFGDAPLWLHRAWQITLQLGSTAAVGLALARRLNPSRRSWFFGVSGWAFLFLMQENTILPHLMICFLIILLGVSPQRFLRTMLVILFASVWAGLSRLNWFPVPGLAAALLYLLEIPRSRSKSWLHYLWKPAVWILLGTGIAFTANSLYNQWSGNAIPGGQFASSLASNLLWYRLLPNVNNPVGILPSVLLVSLPVLVIVISGWRKQRELMPPLRLAGVIAILVVLFAGGLVVSIKIGGGSDLHNMDAYLILLMLTGSYVFFQRWIPERPASDPIPGKWPLAGVAIAVPVLMVVLSISPILVWDRAQAAGSLDAIRDRAVQAASQGGEVLFIAQRHLLALGMVDVPLIPEYEQDTLMEMVMSHNRAYLGEFQADMERQRFAMIVAERQTYNWYGFGFVFGEENDFWVKEVSIPLLCYYVLVTQPEIPTAAVYVPRELPCDVQGKNTGRGQF